MPIQLKEEDNGRLIVFHVSGVLTKEDYDRILPQAKTLLRNHSQAYDESVFAQQEMQNKQRIQQKLRYRPQLQRFQLVPLARGESPEGSHLPSMPLRNSLSDISKAAARAARWRNPTSRAPRSRSEM
jgi:hypothetical protein